VSRPAASIQTFGWRAAGSPVFFSIWDKIRVAT
jgi:hypothetical protein